MRSTRSDWGWGSYVSSSADSLALITLSTAALVLSTGPSEATNWRLKTRGQRRKAIKGRRVTRGPAYLSISAGTKSDDSGAM